MTYASFTSPSWFAGKPAALTHTFGKGTITYIGATLDAPLMHSLVASTLSSAGVQPILPNFPPEVELMQRSGSNGGRMWILINHGISPQTIDLPHPQTDLLTGKQSAAFSLAPHGVLVFALPREQ
jgi:beta-galactosidase